MSDRNPPVARRRDGNTSEFLPRISSLVALPTPHGKSSPLLLSAVDLLERVS